MKKLLKLLFISTMATIPLSSSIVLAACTFSLESTEITISGVTNGSIYIDALPDKSIPGESSSPRSNNKIIDIKIKSPQKGYKITWKIKNNTVRVKSPEGGEVSTELISVQEVKNEPGASSVSLRVKSNTHIEEAIATPTIEFEYFNEKTNSTITPDIKNKSIVVNVHQITVTPPANIIDISKLEIEQNNVHNFNHKDAAVTREQFVNQWIINIVDRKINVNSRYDFVLGKNYNIFLNGVDVKNNNVESIVNDFYDNPDKNTIFVDIKSTKEVTENNNALEGEFKYWITNDPDGTIAPNEPGAKLPGETIDLSNINIASYEYNFNNVSDEFIRLFPENYVQKYATDTIYGSYPEINSTDHYLVTLSNGNNYTKNFWEDQSQIDTLDDFFGNKKYLESDLKNNPVIKFDVKPRDNQPEEYKVTGLTSFSFTNDASKPKAPKLPGINDNDEYIKIPFNSMFEGAPIDLSAMGEGNKDTALLKEGLGGLILDKPILLSNMESIKSSVSKGFDVFHSEITKPTTIQKYVYDKPINNEKFDNNEDGIKDKFVEIIKDKNNWTVNFWVHQGEIGTSKPKENIPEDLKQNKMSTIAYALTVDAKNELKKIFILPEVDSFQFPMYVGIKKNPSKKWEDYYGSSIFRKHYSDNKMGLILGDTVDYISSVPGEILDPEIAFEKATHENILTQQALGTFDFGGVPGKDQNFYLTSGADFKVSEHKQNKTYNFSLEESDNFLVPTPHPSFNNIRAIYGNDILREVTETWARLKFSNTPSGSIPAPLNAEFQKKKVRVTYDVWGNGPEPSSAMPKEIGDNLSLESNITRDTVDYIENAYLLDLTSEVGYSTDGTDNGVNFREVATDRNEFYKVMTGKDQIPVSINEWGFLDEDENIGTLKEQEENWLKYNVYKHTSEKREGTETFTMGTFGGKVVDIIEDKDPNSSAIYLYVNTADKFGGSSEISDKSIRHVIIKINKK